MLKTRMADLFQVRNRFVRSVHLERDFHDPDALKGYVLTRVQFVWLQAFSRCPR